MTGASVISVRRVVECLNWKERVGDPDREGKKHFGWLFKGCLLCRSGASFLERAEIQLSFCDMSGWMEDEWAWDGQRGPGLVWVLHICSPELRFRSQT